MTGPGAFWYNGSAAQVLAASGVTVAPGVGLATWTGLAPTVVAPRTVPIGLGQATWTGLAPTITVSVAALPGTGAATWTGLTPTILTPRLTPIGLGLATWTGLAPTVQIAVVIAPGFGQATWTGLAPTIVTTANKVVTPGVGAALWTGIAPSLPGFGVAPAVGGRGKRVYADFPQRKPAKVVPYFEMAEDAVVTPSLAVIALRGQRPRVYITNVQAEAQSDEQLALTALDDEDLGLALSLADTWL